MTADFRLTSTPSSSCQTTFTASRPQGTEERNGRKGRLLPDGTLSGVAWNQKGDSHEDEESDGGEGRSGRSSPVQHGYVERPGDWPWSSLHRHVRMGWLDAEWPGSRPVELPPVEE